MVEFSEYLPKIGAASVIGFFLYIVLFIIICVVIVIVTYLIVRRLKFNKKIVIFEKIGRDFMPTRKDAAIVRKFGEAGDTVFYCRKSKKFLPTPILQTGKSTYWFFIREDGEWINFTLGNFNEDSRRAGAKFLDKEMRYARIAMQRNLRERHLKIGFLERYGGMIAYTALILVTGIAMWLFFDKLSAMADTINRGIELAAEVQEATRDTLTALNNIRGGSGIVPAG